MSKSLTILAFIHPLALMGCTSQAQFLASKQPTAFDTFDPLHQRLIDHRMLNVVLVLVLTTATLGPVLTERFAPRMLEDSYSRKAENA
jgi:hypothetical protein